MTVHPQHEPLDEERWHCGFQERLESGAATTSISFRHDFSWCDILEDPLGSFTPAVEPVCSVTSGR